MDSEHTLKILTIGESGVGKTCILLRYTDNKFVQTHLTTIGIKPWEDTFPARKHSPQGELSLYPLSYGAP